MRLVMHTLGITATTAGVVLVTLLPFLPGGYDPSAAPLSFVCRFFGLVGPVLLVPVGAAWVASRYWSALARRQHIIAIAAVMAATMVWGATVLLPAVFTSPLIALAAGLVWVHAVSAIFWPRWKRLRAAAGEPARVLPLYLLVVPLAVALIQAALLGPAIELSRQRAIRNAAPLIAAIERYRAAQGRYPPSLFSLWTDQYKPNVIGIEKYHYEPHEEAYNLIFEQIARAFGTREFVVYNPRDRQVMTAHLVDLLELTPEQLALERTRGHYAVHDAGVPRWKYFWFD